MATKISGLTAASVFAASDEVERNSSGTSPSRRLSMTLLFGDQFAVVGQLKFPATQLASTNANTLDDYEEGTWTPIDSSGAGLSISSSTGTYTKIGRVVYWHADIEFPATADASNALIGGLPFTINPGVSAEGRGGAFVSLKLIGASVWVENLQLESSTTFRPYRAAGVRATNADLTGCAVYVAGFYRI